VVTTTLHADGRVSVENVPSWRTQRGLAIECREYSVYGGHFLGRAIGFISHNYRLI
jgi:hypothetical protein